MTYNLTNRKMYKISYMNYTNISIIKICCTKQKLNCRKKPIIRYYYRCVCHGS